MVSGRSHWRFGSPALPLLLVGLACARGKSAPAPSSEICTDGSAIEVLHHAIDLAVELTPPSLSATGELRLRARRSTATLSLDAHGLSITEAATSAGPIRFRQAGDRLCVDLGHPVDGGTELVLKMAWNVPANGKVPRFATDHVWAGYDAAAWMPTLQDPSQRATLALRITSRSDVKVAGTGRTLGQTPSGSGRRTHSFVLERPTPPFLYAFAAGRFDEAELAVDDIKLRALGPTGADLDEVLAISASMYRFLRKRAGVSLPSPEYLQVFVVGDAAQEAAGLSILSSGAIDDVRKDPTDDWIFSHELSHQWFGWLIPCADFSDFWLNEGFATFLAAAFKEQRWGQRAYERELDVWRARSAKVHAQGRDAPVSLSRPGSIPTTPPRESELQPRGVTYYRGALVLHKLRGELGDAAFWAGIRRYVNERAGKSTRTEDLRAAMQTASGRDLREFFDKWVYSSAPDL
jgi:aminopeptidase N